ncbi:transposase [Streptomyces brasiliensis]|uniref:Transposase IS701-like DDE domain-containing protein n=1 Tax=Streptomyces brasiliensis TaxID=1954 RepID=A0A917KA78_9ACTN|nr:transposase [Streptomyces brasiliensis]GGJ03568.1 hypothetical protein GCM10010121_012370 [Streptomyces brasiliensis]
MSRSPWDHEPVDDRRIDLLMPAPTTAPHDGGALLPDDSGDRKSGHATAYVSRQCLASRGRVGNGIVAAATARADERVHHLPHTVPCQPAPALPQGPADPAFRTKGQLAAHLVLRARVATPYSVAVEPNTPLMTETGKSPPTVADHPADAMHSPSRRGRRHVTRRYRDAAPPENCPLPLVDVAFGFCRRQLPTSEPPVVSDSARAGHQPVQSRTRQPVRHPNQHCGRGKPPPESPCVNTPRIWFWIAFPYRSHGVSPKPRS